MRLLRHCVPRNDRLMEILSERVRDLAPRNDKLSVLLVFVVLFNNNSCREVRLCVAFAVRYIMQ